MFHHGQVPVFAHRAWHLRLVLRFTFLTLQKYPAYGGDVFAFVRPPPAKGRARTPPPPPETLDEIPYSLVTTRDEPTGALALRGTNLLHGCSHRLPPISYQSCKNKFYNVNIHFMIYLSSLRCIL